jgi:hypothetical protein
MLGRANRVAQVVEYLCSKHEAVSSNPCTTTEREEGRKEGRREAGREGGRM